MQTLAHTVEGVTSTALQTVGGDGQAVNWSEIFTKRTGVSAAGAVSGMYLFHRHPVLGFVAGSSIADTAYDLVAGNRPKTAALADLGTAAAAVAGSLMWRRHPAMGFFAGLAAGAAGAYFVPGSTSHAAFSRWMHR